MGKHKDPEVTDESGQSGAAPGKAGENAAAADPAGDAAASDSARRGRRRRGGKQAAAGDRSGDERTAEAAGTREPEGSADKPVDETADESAAEPTEAWQGPGSRRAEPHPEAGTETQADADVRERDEAHANEIAYHDAAVSDLAEQVAEERGHRTLYATLLYILVGALAVAGLTLWGAPKVAPHLPAAIAQYLMPGQLETAERLAALEQRLAERAEESDAAIAGLGDRLATLAAEVEAAAAAGETEAAIAEAREAAEAAAADAAALAGRIGDIESRLAGLREEVDAVSDTLTGAGEGAAPPELAAAIASLRARVDQLAGTVEGGPPTAALAERLEALAGRMDELETSLAAAREAEGEVSSAIREARLQSAFDTLAGRLAAGQPFAAALDEIASLAGTEPPQELAAQAGTGLATAAELEASFGRHAQAAIAADIRTASGEGTLGQALGWLRAQVAGRPVDEQAGDGAPAITSRVAARLEEGRLDAALAEAETLRPAAREAMSRWLERLRARVAAETALSEWRAQVAAGNAARG